MPALPTINQRYVAIRSLTGPAERGDSRVYLTRDRQHAGRLTALKIFDVDLSPERPDASWTAARREFEILRRIRHPQVAEVYNLGRVEEISVDARDSSANEKRKAKHDDNAHDHPRRGEAFLASEFIDGVNLRQAYLQLFSDSHRKNGNSPPRARNGTDDSQSWRTFLMALARIAMGLEGIHTQGLIHHDIKPENLLVILDSTNNDTPESFTSRPVAQLNAKIIDFGFAQRETTPLAQEIRGTVPYIAPELMTDGFADGRSDLYSLGLSIYHALSGRLPFGVETVEEWIEVISKEKTLDLRTLEDEQPEDLTDIVRRLTQPDPADRFPDAGALIDALERAGNFCLVERSRPIRRRGLTTGWENELGLLRSEIENLPRSESAHVAVLVEAEEESDSDRFLDEVQTLTTLSESWCIRCSTRRPYRQPYQPVADALRLLTAEIDVSSSAYKRFKPTLARFIPEIQSDTRMLRASPARQSHRTDRAHLEEQLAEFLLQLGAACPVVLIFDELQRADSDTLELIYGIAEVLHRRQTVADENLLEGLISDAAPHDEPADDWKGEAPTDSRSDVGEVEEFEREALPVRVLMVAVARGDGRAPLMVLPETDAATHDVDLKALEELGEFEGCLRLRLGNLDLGQTREWLSQSYTQSSFSPTTVHDLFEASSGSTRLLEELLRDGSCVPTGSMGYEDPDSEAESSLVGATLGVSSSLGDLLISRLRNLPLEDRDILEVLSILGNSSSLEDFERVLAHLAGPGEKNGELFNETATRIRGLVDRGLLTLDHGLRSPEIRWSHDAPRLLVYSGIETSQRQDLHSAVLEVTTSRANEFGAYHAMGAGRNTDYVANGIQAAEAFENVSSVGSAIRMYEDILRHLGTVKTNDKPGSLRTEEIESTRWRILKRLGDIYRDIKDHARAIEKFTVLLSLQESDPDETSRSEIYRILGQIYQQNGDRANAHFFLEKSLRVLEGETFNQARIDALLALAEYHESSGESDQAEEFARKALEEISSQPDDENYAQVCLQLGKIYTARQLYDYGLKYNLEALKAARRNGEISQILLVTEALGETYASRGEYEKAIEQYTRGVELATLLGTKSSLALLYNAIGRIQYYSANRPQALVNFCRSLRLWQELGHQRGIAKCYNNIGLALIVQDDLRRASECYRRAIEIFARIGDEYGQAAGMNNLASILDLEGRYGEALDYAFRGLEKGKKFKTRTGVAFSYYCIGKIYQAKGELDKATSYAEKSLQIRHELGEKTGIAFSNIQIAELLLLRGRLKSAIQRCDEGEEDCEILENNYGRIVAREIRGRILMQLGEFQKATELLEEVATQARQDQQSLLTGKALYHLGRIAIDSGDFQQAEQRLDRAEAIFRKNNHRRQLTELLLEKCRLYLDMENNGLAEKHLELAYGFLEELGIRDLIPSYFLLRGRCETEGQGQDLKRGEKFLERALLEARETGLSDMEWQTHSLLANIAEELGSPAESQDHLEKGLSILKKMIQGVPAEQAKEFFAPASRRKLLQSSSDTEQPTSVSRSPLLRSVEGAEQEDPRGDRLRLQTEVHELKDLNQRLLKLQEINKAINSELDLPRLLEKILDAVLDLMDAERGYLILTENLAKAPTNGEERDLKEIISVARNMERENIKNPETKISRSISTEVIRSGKPVLTTNAVSDDRFIESKSIRDLRLLSVLCAPLRSQEKILGAIYLDNRHRRHAFKEADLALLETFSDQATTAIENARLSEVIQTRNAELTDLNQQMETLNQRLLNQVHARTSELEITRENLRKQLSKYESHLRFHNIVGKTPRMQQIFQVLERIAPTNLPVLIQGGSGTGKELVARAIYANSTRKDKRFISENCGAISESLLESELFGHIRGAFTGATSERKGLFEIASEGTLFLDEVGEMSLAMQTKLLRVLEEGELRRVGDKTTVKIDVRVISASNRDLRQLVEDGSFREDLYYRLNGVRVDLPALKERREDIPLLVQHFLEDIAEESNLPRKEISQDALLLLVNHNWPGNVRELKHFLERTALLLEGNTINVQDCELDPDRSRAAPVDKAPSATSHEFKTLLSQPLRDARDEFVKYYVKSCYSSNDFNATQAARACGMSRESFHRFLRKYDIRKDDLHNRN